MTGWRLGYCSAAALLLAATAPIGAAARAELVDGVTSEELAAALDDAGLNPEMISDIATGAPVAAGQAGEVRFFVRALECAGAPLSCENLVFFANFDLGRSPTSGDFRVINQYNESQVFGRAYVIEGDGLVGVDYVIELNGGVSKDHLAENIGRWADVIAAFVQQFQEGAGS